MPKLIEKLKTSRAALACAEVMYQALLSHAFYATQRDVVLRRVVRGAWVADLKEVLGAELLACCEDPFRMALFAHERDDESGADEVHGVLIYEVDQRGLVIVDLVVDAAHRRKGVGSELVRAVEEEALRLHRWHLSFVVQKEDRDAMRFWARNGYGPEGIAFAREIERPKVFRTVDGKPLIVTADEAAGKKPTGPLIIPRRYRTEEPS